MTAAITDATFCIIQYCTNIEKVLRLPDNGTVLACDYAATVGDIVVTRIIPKEHLSNIRFNTYTDDKNLSDHLGGGMHVWLVNDYTSFIGKNLQGAMVRELMFNKISKNSLTGAEASAATIYNGLPPIPPKSE